MTLLGADVNGMIAHSSLDRDALHNAAGGGDLENGEAVDRFRFPPV